MEFGFTLGGALGSAMLGVVCGWMGARAPDLQRGPRLVPYRFIMMLCAAVAMMLIVHLVNLAGFHTGPKTSF